MLIGSSQLQWTDLWFVLRGVGNTLLVAIIASFAGTVIGALAGWAGHVSLTARIVLVPFVDVMRSVPLIIQFILTGSFLSMTGHPLNPFFLGTLVLSLYMAVLTSELFRSGLAAVPLQVRKSARSLGMTGFQELAYISVHRRSAPPAVIGLVGQEQVH